MVSISRLSVSQKWFESVSQKWFETTEKGGLEVFWFLVKNLAFFLLRVPNTTAAAAAASNQL